MKKGVSVLFVLSLLVFSTIFVSASWYSDFFGKITGKVVLANGDCNLTWSGIAMSGANNTVGLNYTNSGKFVSDKRFICLNNKFAECGWELNDSKLASKSVNGQVVGNYNCDLANKKWIYNLVKVVSNESGKIVIQNPTLDGYPLHIKPESEDKLCELMGYANYSGEASHCVAVGNGLYNDGEVSCSGQLSSYSLYDSKTITYGVSGSTNSSLVSCSKNSIWNEFDCRYIATQLTCSPKTVAQENITCEQLGGVWVHPAVCGGKKLMPGMIGADCCEFNTCGDGVCQTGEEICDLDCNQTNLTCTDSDGGLNYYVKGNLATNDLLDNDSDYCALDNESTKPRDSSSYLVEYFCSGNLSNQTYPLIYCPNGCQNGRCLYENESSQVCSDLIEKVKNPKDDNIGGYDWTLEYNGSYNSSWLVDGQEKNFTAYYSGFSAYDTSKENPTYVYVSENLQVFDESFDASELLKKDIASTSNVCVARSYYTNDGENKYYVCNWNVLNDNEDIDEYDDQSRQIFWANNNVLVTMYVYFGDYLTSEQIQELKQKSATDFLSDLKDNTYDSIDWENFELSKPVGARLYNSLYLCGSTLDIVVDFNLLECKIEPVVCPEYGYQTKTCQVWDSEKGEYKVNSYQMQCSPGICSGCYVPRWFESAGDNVCLPYGTRFEQQIGFGNENEQNTDRDTLSIAQAESDGEIILNISENLVATLFVEGWGNQTYSFKIGDKVSIDVSGWSEGYLSLDMYVNDVVYNSSNYSESYIDVTFTSTSAGKTVQSINAYCNYNGQIMPQKTTGFDGEWAKCQNNYECSSNICSNGECVDTASLAKEVTGFKAFVVKALCKLTNPFSQEEYEQCLANNA